MSTNAKMTQKNFKCISVTSVECSGLEEYRNSEKSLMPGSYTITYLLTGDGNMREISDIESEIFSDSDHVPINTTENKYEQLKVRSKTKDSESHMALINPQRPPSHQGRVKTLYQCLTCQRSFKTETGCRKHAESHARDRIRTDDASSLSVSPEASRSNEACERQHLCAYCGQRFANSSAMNTHNLRHADERPFLCGECDFATRSLENLKRHAIQHGDARKRACGDCSRTFRTAYQLQRHRRTHTGERPFACAHCSFRTTAADNLKRHTMTHVGGRPMVCPFCPYRACHSSNLKKHVRTHTGEKPYLCDRCTYSCATLFALNRHMTRHSRATVYRYSCPVCDFRCTRLRAYKKHVRTHKEFKELQSI